MSFTETLEALGSWSLELSEETPDEVLAQVGYYGHLVIVDGPVDVVATGNGILAGARYAGVCRAKAKPGTYTREGSGLLHWISDEDGKGYTIETTITLTNATLAQVVTALLPPTVTVGTVFTQAVPATRYTGTHVFQSRRDALAIALAPFGAELRVNPNFTVDVGTPAQLYDTALPLTAKPSPMIVRKGAGSDLDLVAVGGDVDTEGAVWDYSTRIVLLGQTIGIGDEPDTVFATGSINAPSVPWKDPQGNAVKLTRLISESGETTGSVAARTQLQLNRYSRETTAIKVTADDFEISGGFGVGDATYVYDPDSGIVDTAQQVLFRAEPIHPAIIRVTSMTTPIVEGMTVAWRTDTGVWLDLTRWVVWESAGSREITVGDLPKSLTRPSDPIQDRVDAARGKPSTKTPKTPTGLALTTASALNASGDDSSIISATWDPVTQYVDDTTVALHHYEVQFRPQFRSPLWTASLAFGGTSGDLLVSARLLYDVQVRAVSTGGVPSAWSSTQSITSAADSTAPAAPADPVLTQSLGQIRVRYPGTTNVGGAMPADANRVDVEVATAGSGGPFVVESSLNPFVEGIHRVGGTPGQTRWVRLRAFDHNGNPSAYSATVSAVIPQVQDGEIAGMSVGKLLAGTVTADIVMAGRFATALTGARREMNAVGFQAFDASNNLTVSIDGVDNLMTGRFQTALPGSRRISLGASGLNGRINFFAADGSLMYVDGFTASSGVEAMRIAANVVGDTGAPLSSLIVQNNESSFVTGRRITILFGGYSTGTRDFTIAYAPDKSDMNVNRQTFLSITQSGTTFPVASANDFFITDLATGNVRFWVDGNGATSIYTRAANDFFITDAVSGNVRFWADGDGGLGFYNMGSTRFSVNFGGTLGWFDLGSNDGAVAYSPHLRMYTGNAGVGVGIRVNGNTPAAVEFVEWDNSGYYPTRALDYYLSSDGRGKEDVEDLTVLPMIRQGVRPRTFRRKRRGELGATEVGLVAQEAHAALRVANEKGELFLSMGGMAAVALGGVKEAVDMIDELAARVAALEAAA